MTAVADKTIDKSGEKTPNVRKDTPNRFGISDAEIHAKMAVMSNGNHKLNNPNAPDLTLQTAPQTIQVACPPIVTNLNEEKIGGLNSCDIWDDKEAEGITSSKDNRGVPVNDSSR